MGPKYRQIVADIMDLVDKGSLKPGDKIPSSRVLCQQYGVSQTVVNQAVLVLEARGYVIGRPGLGRFVAEEES